MSAEHRGETFLNLKTIKNMKTPKPLKKTIGNTGTLETPISLRGISFNLSSLRVKI
jgi:hypothetical protein